MSGVALTSVSESTPVLPKRRSQDVRVGADGVAADERDEQPRDDECDRDGAERRQEAEPARRLQATLGDERKGRR